MSTGRCIFLCALLVLWLSLPFSSGDNAGSSWDSPDLCLTGSTPFKLADECAMGWYCPLFDPNDNSTVPVQCAATNKCIIDRLQTKFCSRQGKYEPQLCQPGYYCPTPTQKIKCPENHICPLGQYKPIPCGSMTVCEEGSSDKFEWSSMVAIVISDGAVLLIYLCILYLRRYMHNLRDKSYRISSDGVSRASVVPINALPGNKNDYVQVTNQSTEPEKAEEDLEAKEPPLAVSEERHLHALVICEGFKKARENLPPMLVEFQNLSLTIPSSSSRRNNDSDSNMTHSPSVKSTKGNCSNKNISNGSNSNNNNNNQIELLKGVTCSFSPGTVTAIMGPSGAGKTMTLTTMLGQTDPKWIRGGSLKINGQEEKLLSRFKKIVGYVSQEDILHRELTIYENILYSANIRLPASWTSSERSRHVLAVIHALQLAHVQDIRIGDETQRGVSGGQRKRCSVGMELAAAPSLLLLDEPTSGLDATASMELCQLLRDIACNAQLTVAMVIHQPRVEIWQVLDQLLLLAPGGLTVYQGPQDKAVAYFQEIAEVTMHPYENPADALMDHIAKRGTDFTQIWLDRGKAHMTGMIAGSEAVVEAGETYAPFGTGVLRHTASFPKQIYLSFERNLSQQIATVSSLGLEVGLALLAGGLMGNMVEVMYQGILQPPYTLLSPTPLEGLIAGFFFSVGLSISLAAASAGVSVFGEELVIYRKEVAAGHSHLAYYIGVSLAQFPRIFLDSIHFAWIFHIQNQTLTPFRIFFVITLLLYTAIYGLAAIVSMIVSRQNAALLAVVTSLFFSSMTRKGGFPEILQYFSASRWAVEAVFHFETEPYRHIMQVEAVSAVLGGYTLNRVPSDLLYMFLVGVFYRLLAYIAMRYVDQRVLK